MHSQNRDFAPRSNSHRPSQPKTPNCQAVSRRQKVDQKGSNKNFPKQLSNRKNMPVPSFVTAKKRAFRLASFLSPTSNSKLLFHLSRFLNTPRDFLVIKLKNDLS